MKLQLNHHVFKPTITALLKSASIAALAIASLFCMPALASIEGKWRILDPQTGNPAAIVNITSTANGLQAQVESVLSNDAACAMCKSLTSIIEKNDGVLFWGVQQSTENTGRGNWYNPNKQKPQNVQLFQNGQTLEVKTYSGLPVFAHSQYWQSLN